ncbi:ARM repeat superfamily protein [Actinidia rufa]|uniref:ARM repeat superfamily protein n=1 Tax=Actinidia rufa TaxID=165716 RepID=A0A7J0FGZ4_9ERIC|nr:ARM repeat superfamily protein [Actinidia rufa]
MPHLDAQSFDCMLSILQSIDHVVRFFAYWIENSQQELQVSMPPIEGPDATMQGLNITSSLLKKLFDLFPLNPKRHVSGKICSGRPSGKAFYEKQILSLIPFTPNLVWQVSGYWKSRILQAFTNIFRSCNLESSLKWACLSAIEEMLVPRQGLMYLDASDQELLDYQITWIRELPLLLIMLGDKHPLRSRSVLSLLLRLGQCAASNPSFAQEYDNMQYSFAEFYCVCMGERNISYGPFVRLDTDARELSVCCLYYLSAVDSHLLKSLAWSCLCE